MVNAHYYNVSLVDPGLIPQAKISSIWGGGGFNILAKYTRSPGSATVQYI